MITVEGLHKRFGSHVALDDVSFTAPDGKVTGFLGPNGAGKSTTMRSILGLIKPDAGKALVDGKRFVTMRAPMKQVGAVLDAKSAHRARSAYDHLLALAVSNGISKKRVQEVIEFTGLASVRKRKAGSFSLGMNQRLSIAAALLGDPQNLVLDEPVNGLDPEGVKWVRELCRYYASEGRAVLLSSHLMSEVAVTADNLVIIGRGKIITTSTVQEFIDDYSSHAIRLVTPEPEKLLSLLEGNTHIELKEVERTNAEPQQGVAYRITGANMQQLAYQCAQAQLVMYEFAQEHTSLEDAYMKLTHSQVEYATREVPNSATAAANSANANANADASANVDADVNARATVNQVTNQSPTQE